MHCLPARWRACVHLSDSRYERYGLGRRKKTFEADGKKRKMLELVIGVQDGVQMGGGKEKGR